MKKELLLGLTTLSSTLAGCAALPDTCETYKTCPPDDASADADVLDGSTPSSDATVDGTTVGPDGSLDGPHLVDAGEDAPPGCTEDASYCGPATGCVDTTSSPMNCGSCGHACPTIPNGNAVCSSNTCSIGCNTGYHLCNGACLSNSDDPGSDPCIVSDTFGTFASPTGSDTTGTGTQAAPFATIGKAAAAAMSAGLAHVFACGTFTSSVTITSTMAGRLIHGGFDCTTWAWSNSTPTRISPTAQGPALVLDGATATFDHFAFTAAPATAVGGSSIATQVTSQSNAIFDACSFAAGAGLAGNPGSVPTASLGTPQPGNGADPNSNDGGASVTCSCPNGVSSVGGQGGTGGDEDGGAPGNGANGSPPLSADEGAASPAAGAACSNGTTGASGAPGASALSPSTLGTIASNAWLPTGGASGGYGATGQGGGGGGGGYADKQDADGNGGGGGGCGGCGGGGGTGGGGGGSSIGLLIIDSNVTLSASSIQTSTAGAGGSGAGGQAGAAGAKRGDASSGNGCQGGNGGVGGTGGTGAGGSGGVSVGVAYQGTAPTLDAATQAAITIAATVAAKGTGGTPGVNDGMPGQNASTLQLP